MDEVNLIDICADVTKHTGLKSDTGIESRVISFCLKMAVHKCSEVFKRNTGSVGYA